MKTPGRLPQNCPFYVGAWGEAAVIRVLRGQIEHLGQIAPSRQQQPNKTAFRASRNFHVLRKGQLLQSQHQNGGHSRPTRTPARSGLRGLRGAPSQQGLGCTPVSFWGSEWLVLCCPQQPLRFVAVVSWGQCLCTPMNTTLSRPGGLPLFCPLQ